MQCFTFNPLNSASEKAFNIFTASIIGLCANNIVTSATCDTKAHAHGAYMQSELLVLSPGPPVTIQYAFLVEQIG